MSFTLYSGKASWFCCNPDPCGCDEGCCQGSNCSYAGCDQSTHGKGGCCTCHSNDYQIAWKNPGCPSCCNYGSYKAISCGEYVAVKVPLAADSTYRYAKRSDTGPAPCVMVDLTKALFSSFASLSVGLTDVVLKHPIS